MKIRLLICWAGLLLCPLAVFSQCLNGSYTLGGTNPDFDSFFQLEQRLLSDGLCGPVEILLRDGTYSEILTLNNISGSSAANPLTIRSESGNPNNVILNAPVNNPFGGVVRISFMQYVTIQDMSIRPSENGGTYSQGIDMTNASQFITLRGIILQGIPGGNTGSSGYSLIRGTQVSDILIEKCTLSNSMIGISSGAMSQENKNWIIRNNRMEQLRTATLLVAMKDVLLEDNYVEGDLVTPLAERAFQLQGMGITLRANTVITDGAALSINADGDQVVLTNNMLAVFPQDNNQFSMANVSGAETVTADHNTIVMAEHDAALPTAAFSVTATGLLTARNNIFVNQANQGFAVNYNSPVGDNTIDHNIYFSNDETVQIGFQQIYTLEAWQMAQQQDANSRVALPQFAGPMDLHLDADAAVNQFSDGMGIPLATVLDDIDGDLRNTSMPDIGADEFASSLAGIDTRILNTNMTGSVCDQVHPVQLVIQNTSDVTLTYLEVNWSIDGQAGPGLIYEGPLAPGASTVLTLDTTYLVQEEMYNFNFNISLPNNAVDINPADNTFNTMVTVFPKAQPVIISPEPLCPQGVATLALTEAYPGYAWSTGATTADIMAAAGTYEVTVTDDNGCTATEVIWLRENDIVSKKAWKTDGEVYDIEVWGDQVFVGGTFEVVAPHQPGLGAIDRVTGRYVPFPSLEEGNAVHAIISDGQGGYFVGGDFAVIGEKARQNLAHIKADGEVSAWRADANGLVYALSLIGDQLFVGGDFTQISGRDRSAVAVVDARYGHATDWVSSVFEPGDIVRAFSQYEDYLVVGGAFERSDPIFGSYNLFLIDQANGNFPNLNNNLQTFDLPEVLDIELYQNTLYLGTLWGFYSLSINTGMQSNLSSATGSNPVQLARNGERLYVQIPYGLYEYDLTNQAYTNWEILDFEGSSSTLTTHAGQLLLGGDFTETVSSIDLGGLRIFDLNTLTETASTTHMLSNGFQNGEVYCIYADENRIIFGGFFDAVGGEIRNNLFAFDGQTGIPTNWRPDPDGRVRTIHTDLERLYVGGGFSTIADEARMRVAAFDENGQLTPWSVELNNGDIWKIATSDTAVYIGGGFSASTSNYRNLAAFQKSTGDLIPLFRPNPDDYVSELVVIDSVVIASGRYEMLYFMTDSLYFCGGFGLSVLRADNSELVRNYSLQSQFINDLKYYNGLAYIGGRFTSIANNDRARIAAVAPDTLPFVDWSQGIDDEVYALALGYGAAFAGGQFAAINGSTSFDLGAMDLTQSDTPFDFMPNDPLDFNFLYDTEVYEGELWLGGQFTRVFEQNRSHLAAIRLGCLSDDVDLLAGPDAGFEFLSIDTTQLVVTFGNSSIDASRFVWDFGDGQSSTAINPTHRYATPGMYEVCLTADHSTGRSTTCAMLNLMPVGTIDPAFAQKWTLFPNPVAGQLYLQTADTEWQQLPWRIQLRDVRGKLVQQATLPAGSMTRLLTLPPSLPAGSYQLEVFHADRLLGAKTIVRQE